MIDIGVRAKRSQRLGSEAVGTSLEINDRIWTQISISGSRGRCTFEGRWVGGQNSGSRKKGILVEVSATVGLGSLWEWREIGYS